MIRRDKDPTLATLFLQEGLAKLGFDPGPIDNWAGARTKAAQDAWKAQFLLGDGTWGFVPRIDQGDILIEDVICTCFGGSDDPQDNGDTASGLNTKSNPGFQGASVPMDISKSKHVSLGASHRIVRKALKLATGFGKTSFGVSESVHRALDGCPIPVLDWFTPIQIESNGRVLVTQIIDLGPGKQATTNPSEPHAVDLTVAAARFFDSHASATNFEMRCNVRIIGGAKYAGS